MEKKKTLFQSNRIYQIPIERIVPNPRQPRRHFDSQAMKELAESIRQHGMLQPISVQKTTEGYVLVAGERRLRAASMAGLDRVPCILVRGSDRDSALLALVENLQRCDLHYTEEAAAIARLISTYGMSQEEAARRLGRSQSAVANKLRLLKLSPECVDKLRQYGGCGGGVHRGPAPEEAAGEPGEAVRLYHQGCAAVSQQRGPQYGEHPPGRCGRPLRQTGERGRDHHHHPDPQAARRPTLKLS